MSDDVTQTMRFPRELAELVGIAAQVQGVSMNELVRQAVAARIEELRKDGVFQARIRESIERNRELLERLVVSVEEAQPGPHDDSV